jgi:hypothetical protein
VKALVRITGEIGQESKAIACAHDKCDQAIACAQGVMYVVNARPHLAGVLLWMMARYRLYEL